ncbi:MAG: hypothetical protein A2Z16_02170 [Chloroflexi bacterium RBG_16_54_18]|nr:MAG: hypothetical protein A2Z16_02170 [Chloroflexi bacterium RBG_16_54_18]
MKLIIAIIQNTDSDTVSQALVEGKFRITRIASTGGFFRRGSTTFMIVVRDERVELAIEEIRRSLSPQTDASEKRATLFVIPVESFEQI